TLNRRLSVFAKPSFRQSLSTACTTHARLGPASLVLYDVTTLHFETDAGDGFREPGFSKERRLDPQITLGLLTDASGFPLTVAAFEGNKAETATMVPVINAFKTAHHLSDVTVVADAGMISEANQVALQAAGLSYILGARLPYLPDVVREWRDKHPDEAVPDALVLTQPWRSTSSEKARGIPDRVIHYQYRHDRARRTLRGIDEQVAKAQRAVDGHAPVKRNRYIQLSGATRSVNRQLEAKTRALAGWKGYTTNLVGQPPAFVIDAYHQLWRIEKAFRMSKHDLQARPIYHRTRDSIEAHPDRRISLRSALFSSAICEVTPGRWPVSTSERRIQVRNVSGVPIPNMPATALIAAHCEGYCGRTSATMRTARSRSSSGYLLGRPIIQILPRSEVSGNAGTGQSTPSSSTPNDGSDYRPCCARWPTSQNPTRANCPTPPGLESCVLTTSNRLGRTPGTTLVLKFARQAPLH